MTATAVRAGFVYDVYLADGAVHEGVAHWALLKPGDDLDLDHRPVHVERVLRVEDTHYVIYGTWGIHLH
jgi:hypothetical protein